MIDSRMAMCQNAMEEHADGTAPDEAWTDYNRLFEGSLYAGDEKADQWATYRLPAQQIEGPGMVPPRAARSDSDADAAGPNSEDDNKLNLDLFPD